MFQQWFTLGANGRLYPICVHSDKLYCSETLLLKRGDVRTEEWNGRKFLV